MNSRRRTVFNTSPHRARSILLCAAFLLLILASAAPVACAVDDQAISSAFLSYFANSSAVVSSSTAPRTAASALVPPPRPHPTMAVNDVTRNWDKLSDDTRKKLSPHIKLSDPDDGGVRQVLAYENGVCTETLSEGEDLTRDSAHFRIVYTTEGQAAATSDFVDQALAAAENAYSVITGLGFPAPLTPPDGLLRIYLCDVYGTFGYYGLTWPEEIFSESDTARTHIELDNDYEGVVHEYGMDSPKLLQATIAHEFFHATQFAMIYSASSFWIMESTAVWMEARAFPDINGYVTEYLIDRFANVHEPIDYWSNENTIGYGDAILFQYITQHVADDSFIYSFWDNLRTACAAQNPPGYCSSSVNELPLLETLLGNLGTTLSAVYADCVRAMFLKDFEDGGLSYYPAVGVRMLGTSASGELDHLSSLFYRMDLCSGQDPKILNVSLNGTGGDVWKLTLFKQALAGGGFATETVTLTDGAGTAAVTGYCSEFSPVTALVSNISTSADNRTFSITVSVQNPPGEIFTHVFGPGWRMVGTPIQPEISDPVQSLDVDNLRILARFKLGRYLTNGEHDPTAAGQAFWLYFENVTNTVSVQGYESSTDTVALAAGWNMISLPFNSAAPWDETVQIVTPGGSYALGSAQANAYLEPTLYSWDATAGGWAAPVSITGGFTIQPWDGFALKALQSCSIKFPKP